MFYFNLNEKENLVCCIVQQKCGMLFMSKNLQHQAGYANDVVVVVVDVVTLVVVVVM